MEFERAVRRVDVVLDLIGGLTQERSLPLVKPGGLLISTVVRPSREHATNLGVMALKMRTNSRGDQLVQIGDLIAHGDIKVFVDKVFPLAQVDEALNLSRQGHSRGKIVINVDHDACHPFS
jgi:NADPH:quinone reductase-like Zn-dependent oxidoreductase